LLEPPADQVFARPLGLIAANRTSLCKPFAILNYSNTLVAYEASLKVTGTLMQMSLMNYI
jgi:hypothetical protein